MDTYMHACTHTCIITCIRTYCIYIHLSTHTYIPYTNKVPELDSFFFFLPDDVGVFSGKNANDADVAVQVKNISVHYSIMYGNLTLTLTLTSMAGCGGTFSHYYRTST